MPTDPASRPTVAADVEAIERVVARFLEGFVSGPEAPERLAALHDLFVPGAVVVRTCGDEPVVLDVDGFIAPRAALLTSGELEEFREWPVAGTTQVFGDVAHWFGTYAKAGVQGGTRFEGRGAKSVQLVRTGRGWRISALAWDDEREGVRLPEAPAPSPLLVRPPALTDQVPYAYAAVVPPGRLAFTAGACPLDAEGGVVAPGDLVGQARQVVANLTATLAAVGADLHDVVRTTVYVASLRREDLSTVWDVVHDAFGDHEPPSTLLGVGVLGWPDQLVEVEAVAAVPTGG